MYTYVHNSPMVHGDCCLRQLICHRGGTSARMSTIQQLIILLCAAQIEFCVTAFSQLSQVDLGGEMNHRIIKVGEDL